MQADEDCGYCRTLLDVHCTLHGPEFCEIKDQYYTDPAMGIDDVYDRLLAIATPDQITEAKQVVLARKAAGLDPPDPPPRANEAAAQAAAQKWLRHWQGRET
jgi:hypothetical protein